MNRRKSVRMREQSREVERERESGRVCARATARGRIQRQSILALQGQSSAPVVRRVDFSIFYFVQT